MRKIRNPKLIFAAAAMLLCVCHTLDARAQNAAGVASGPSGTVGGSEYNGRTGVFTYQPGVEGTHYVTSPERQKAAVTTPTQRALEAHGSGASGSYNREVYAAKGAGAAWNGTYNNTATGNTVTSSGSYSSTTGASGVVTQTGSSGSTTVVSF